VCSTKIIKLYTAYARDDWPTCDYSKFTAQQKNNTLEKMWSQQDFDL